MWETLQPTGNCQVPWGAVDAGRQSRRGTRGEGSRRGPQGPPLAVASETEEREEHNPRP